jgi:hypothetical protein
MQRGAPRAARSVTPSAVRAARDVLAMARIGRALIGGRCRRGGRRFALIRRLASVD